MAKIWANTQQLIELDSITMIVVNDACDSGTAYVAGYPDPIQLEGARAAEYLQSFKSTRPK